MTRTGWASRSALCGEGGGEGRSPAKPVLTCLASWAVRPILGSALVLGCWLGDAPAQPPRTPPASFAHRAAQVLGPRLTKEDAEDVPAPRAARDNPEDVPAPQADKKPPRFARIKELTLDTSTTQGLQPEDLSQEVLGREPPTLLVPGVTRPWLPQGHCSYAVRLRYAPPYYGWRYPGGQGIFTPLAGTPAQDYGEAPLPERQIEGQPKSGDLPPGDRKTSASAPSIAPSPPGGEGRGEGTISRQPPLTRPLPKGERGFAVPASATMPAPPRVAPEQEEARAPADAPQVPGGQALRRRGASQRP
jgi:hypothetical protein